MGCDQAQDMEQAADLLMFTTAQALQGKEVGLPSQDEAAQDARQSSSVAQPQSPESAASQSSGVVKRQAKEFQMLGEKATLRPGKAKRDPWNPLQNKIASGVKGLAKWKSGVQ